MTAVLDENQKLSPSVATRTQLPPAKVLLMNDFEPCVRHWKAEAVVLRPLSCFSSPFSITNWKHSFPISYWKRDPVCLLCTSPSFGLCCLNSHEAPFVGKMLGLIFLKCSQIAKPRRVWKIEHSCAHAVSKSSKTVHLYNFKLSFLALSY